MEANKYKRKFKLLFDKFFQNNYELNSYYAESLLKVLEDSPDKSAKILDTPFFSDLLVSSIKNLANSSISVKTFIVELINIIMKNELQFSKLVHMQGFQMLAANVCDFNLENFIVPKGLYVAGIKLATAQTLHYSGLMWLVEHKVWQRILTKNTHLNSAILANASYNFIAKVVWKLEEFDEEATLVEVLRFVAEPIIKSEYQNVKEIDAENEKALYYPILSYLNALLAIVSDEECNKPQNNVIRLLSRYFIVEGHIHMITEVTRNQDVINLLTSITFYMVMAMGRDMGFWMRGDVDIATEIITGYYNTIVTLIKKRMGASTIYFAVKCIVTWSKIDVSMIPDTFQRHGRTFNVRNQFIILVLTPLLTYSYNVFFTRKNQYLIDALEVYNLKLNKLTSEHVVKACYSFKALMESSDAKMILIQTLREIFKLKGCLNVAQAGLLYQALYYTLQVYVISDGSGGLIINYNPLKSPDDVKVLSLVMEAIKMLLKEHNINWYENVEIICLQTTLMDLLKQNFMPSKQLLQAIDLIDLSIKKFLSPDMALLMESKRGSALNEIGKVLKSYIQHEEWEVRDSALQLLLSCTDVAFIKYIPLQKLLSENKLLSLAAKAALSDQEYYVQTTALRCLAAATKIEGIWREMVVGHSNLYMQLIYVLRNNSEGIVRKEAANVLTEIYVNRKTTKNFAKSLYNVMATAALHDLHWEVQTAALSFWKHAVQTHLSNKGMIDGKFPSFTFSKEKRKIIMLNEKEIINQLIGIMHELADIGCLTVLYKCLNEEFHVDVIEQAYVIARDLVKILGYYKYNNLSNETNGGITREYEDSFNGEEQIMEESVEPTSPVPMDLSCVLPREQAEFQHRVIEDIAKTTYYELIGELYENYIQIKSENMEEDDFSTPPINLIDPGRFLKKFRETDYLSLIENKKNWNAGHSSLDLLLDEALALGEVREDIPVECNSY